MESLRVPEVLNFLNIYGTCGRIPQQSGERAKNMDVPLHWTSQVSDFCLSDTIKCFPSIKYFKTNSSIRSSQLRSTNVSNNEIVTIES